MATTRNLWPLGIITAFALFFSGIIAVIVIASTHRDSLVSQNYYEQELKFQNQIDGSERARKAGAGIEFEASSGKLLVFLPVAQLAQNVAGTVELYRPSAPELDRNFPLTPGTDGKQTLDVSKLATGLWQVRVKWNAGGQNYFLEQKITILKG